MSSFFVPSLRCQLGLSRRSLIINTSPIGLAQRYRSTKHKPLSTKTALETAKAVSPGTKPPAPSQQKSAVNLATSHLQKSAVNPTESTLPPPLNVPEKQPNEGLKYYLKVGKSYVEFYKAALKAVTSNHREAKAIVSRIKVNGPATSLAAAARSGLLTRAEFQFVHRSRSDFRKLPLLGLLLVVCGEYLPLVVIFFSGLVPRTAWIPKQTERARTAAEKRRKDSFRDGTLQGKDSLSNLSRLRSVDDLTSAQILHMSRALGLHSTFWEKFSIPPPHVLAKSRVAAAVEYLSADDYAVSRDGGVSTMSDEEVKIACEERGIDVLKEDVSTLRFRLEMYLQRRLEDDIGIPAMTLVRPNQWGELRKGTE